MRIRRLLLAGLAGILALSVSGTAPALAAYPNPGVVTGSTNAHDPTIVKRPTGGYLVATTGDGIALKTSTNRTAFVDAGKAFPNGTSWATSYTGGSANLWAPDLSYRNGRYWLYYSASTFGSSKSAIFLATSTTGAAGSWTHVGKVIESTTSSGWNAIDPNLTVTPSGEWWLTFGSFWSGIKMVKLSASTGLRADSTMYNIAERFVNSKSVEAPYIHYRNGYYYLFMSFDFCCQGASSTYRTMVARSLSGTGVVAANSSGDQPAPSPATSRPPLNASRVASSRASRSGRCSGTTSTPVPSVIRSVTAAAVLSETSASATPR
jgi:arabinan endo-1,5-alpha-L-arabinosidase